MLFRERLSLAACSRLERQNLELISQNQDTARHKNTKNIK